MKILLDTHTFLWWITDDRRLSLRAREAISNEENELFVSAATGWEIAIKVRIGRLDITDEPQRFVLEQLRINAFRPLSIGMEHTLHVSTLPDYHRDPFDRVLIAQAQVEGMPIVTADPNIEKYQVEVIW